MELGHEIFQPDVIKYLSSTFTSEQLNNITTALPLPPKWTTIRVNSRSDSEVQDIMDLLAEYLPEDTTLSKHPVLQDVLLVRGVSSVDDNMDHQDVPRVIVDNKCGKAVLRGADVFSPGVKGLPHLAVGTTVAVHVDIHRKCKRGEKGFTGNTVLVGYGEIKMTRHDIFKKMINCGTAVCVTQRKVNVPCLNNILQGRIFLQNLPSILTCRVLDPRPGELVLDMCAAPGGKTTHIAQLMEDRGRVIALEKVQNKVDKLKHNIKTQSLGCIDVFKWDATKVFDENSINNTLTPPFGREVFDRILVDAPCSALGQRPQLINPSKLSEISSYPSYQWCFVADAIKMLKPGGVLVYSTCTLPKQENEMMVVRVLEVFPQMRLVATEPLLGGPGVKVDGLSDGNCKMVQRFLSGSILEVEETFNSDTIGFFIAKFRKLKEYEI